jgi:hypothetical protein
MTERKIPKVLQKGPKNRAELLAALGHAKLGGNLKKALHRSNQSSRAAAA